MSNDNNIDEYSDYNDDNIYPIKELMSIGASIHHLNKSMQKYIDDSKYLWDETVLPFIESADCNTLHNLRHDDYDKFIKFMMEQHTYKLMIESKKRLIKRKEYLNKIIN